MARRHTIWLEVLDERVRQVTKHGDNSVSSPKIPDGTGKEQQAYLMTHSADVYREICDHAFDMGVGTRSHILIEEVAEVLECEDKNRLRMELVQLAAAAVGWIEALDKESER